MQHITGISRQQMRFSSLEDTISPDNQVRFIDAFLELIDISKLDFAIKTLKTESRHKKIVQRRVMNLKIPNLKMQRMPCKTFMY